MTAIPIIDLSQALLPGAPGGAEAARQLRDAAMNSGFFYVRNHGVEPGIVERQFALTRRLFELPPGDRAALSIRHSPTRRGFESVGEQTLDASARPDLKESFYCGMDLPDDHPYVRAGYPSYGHNQWPQALPEAPPQCEAYIQAMLALSGRLTQLLALSLGLPESWFDVYARCPMITLRMIRYPPHPANADERTFGAGAHTDWGMLTILAQDTHGGLEVCMPDGHWIAASPIPDTLVVNLGDMVPRWTNGLYHSNPHRVRNQYSGGDSRYSIPFFYDPDHQARVEALPGTVAPGEQPLYPPCTAGEHLEEMYRRTYDGATQEAPV